MGIESKLPSAQVGIISNFIVSSVLALTVSTYPYWTAFSFKISLTLLNSVLRISSVSRSSRDQREEGGGADRRNRSKMMIMKMLMAKEQRVEISRENVLKKIE